MDIGYTILGIMISVIQYLGNHWHYILIFIISVLLVFIVSQGIEKILKGFRLIKQNIRLIRENLDTLNKSINYISKQLRELEKIARKEENPN